MIDRALLDPKGPPTGDARRRAILYGQAAALTHPRGSGLIITDGLGALGCGSWSDGPAAVAQDALHAAWWRQDYMGASIG